MKKFLLVIIDGAADEGRSAFAAAKKPHLDMLASNSTCGLWSGPHAPHYNPRSMSSVATLEILGYSYHDEPGRGYLEALGLDLKPGKSLCLRGNFACVDKNMKVIDRRAGRDEHGLDILVRDINKKIKAINNVKIKVHRLIGHRVVVVFSGKGLDKHVTDSDYGNKTHEIKPLEHGAKKTAEILNIFEKQVHSLLSGHKINKKRKVPANYMILRGAGSVQPVRSFNSKYNVKACSISGVNIIRGISRYLGISIIDVPLNQLETDLHLRARKAIEALDRYNFVILHINGADTCSHDKNFAAKVKFLEKVDAEVFSQITKMRSMNIAVISDHVTNSNTGEHIFGSVPFLIYCPEEDIEEGCKFDEKSCKGSFIADNPMKKILYT
ncbi:MAG TPA: hypothetical protein VJB05_02240 [archaeon]|nr:hypothetical protein [archaeon]